jgi:hypothetical protein
MVAADLLIFIRILFFLTADYCCATKIGYVQLAQYPFHLVHPKHPYIALKHPFKNKWGI